MQPMITINALSATGSECAASVNASEGTVFLRSEYALFLSWLSRVGASGDPRSIPRYYAPNFKTNDRRLGSEGETAPAESGTLQPLEAVEYLMEESVAMMVKERYGASTPHTMEEDRVAGDPTAALTATMHSLTYEPNLLLQRLVKDHGLVLWYGQFTRINFHQLCMTSAKKNCVVLELSHVVDKISAWMLQDEVTKSLENVGIEASSKEPPVFPNQLPEPDMLVASGRVPVWLPSEDGPPQPPDGGLVVDLPGPVQCMVLCLTTCVLAMLLTRGAPTYRAEHNGRVGEFSVTERLSDFITETIPFALSPRVGIAVSAVIFENVRPKASRGWFAPSPEQHGTDARKLRSFVADTFPPGTALLDEMCSAL